jgi:hypothetical protein
VRFFENKISVFLSIFILSSYSECLNLSLANFCGRPKRHLENGTSKFDRNRAVYLIAAGCSIFIEDIAGMYHLEQTIAMTRFSDAGSGVWRLEGLAIYR